jgi:hypothetical protein
MKLVIYRTNAHDHTVGELDGEEIFGNDYGIENVIRLARALEIEVETVTLSREEFELKFC